MAQSLLKAEHVKISFGNVHALRDVSLEILPGEIHCLMGENGCGKSTLIKIISGVYQRDGGTVEFNGQKLDKITPIDAINLGIQVIYQDFALFPNLTVAENLALNTELAWKENGKLEKCKKDCGRSSRENQFPCRHGSEGQGSQCGAETDGSHQPRSDVRRKTDHYGRTHDSADKERGGRAV